MNNKNITKNDACGKDIKYLNGKHIVSLNVNEIMNSGFLTLPDISPYQKESQFLRAAYIQSRLLPKIFHERIYEFIYETNEFGILLLRNLPVDKFIPDTPENSLEYPDKDGFLAEFWLAAVAETLGGAVSYKQEKNGNIFQNIVPVKMNELKLSSESSCLHLDFHTEVAFHPHKVDYVVLLCIRPDHNKQAKTFVASARMILNNLTADDIDTLSKSIFKTDIDYSFGSENGKKGNGRCVSVLYGNKLDPYLLYDLDLMTGMTDEADQALSHLRIAGNKAKVSTTLEKGDMLIIDNNKAIHGRTAFSARYNGKDKWFMRTCAMRSLLASCADRGNTRII